MRRGIALAGRKRLSDNNPRPASPHDFLKRDRTELTQHTMPGDHSTADYS